MDISFPVEKIPRIGPQYQRRLKRLGIDTVGQLLYHFPHRYEDFSNLKKISEIKSGENVSVQGKILDIKNIRTFKKRMFLTQATLEDETGTIKAIWFNRPYLTNALKKNDLVFLSGKTAAKSNKYYLSSPAYEKISDKSDPIHTARLVPVYPETEGLSSRWLRYILQPLLNQLKNRLGDPLPEEIKKKRQLLPLNRAIWQIHFPDSLALAKKSRERFCFEELFLMELRALKERMRLKKEKAINVTIDLETIQKFVKSLPFQLTSAQKKSAWQILKDMEKQMPMNRLLEGDVGSRKTIVAMMAVLNTIKNKSQAALMAPTEILAKQHYKTFNDFLGDFKVSIGFLTGKECKLNNKRIERKKLLEKIEKGEVDFLIGTNALVQGSDPLKNQRTPKVKFNNLALVIIDEQHRFGIEQRARLARGTSPDKKFLPHLLSMTATPIPRTMALTIYGDLDVSLIDELPKGRKKVITKIIPPEKRKEAYGFIRKEVKKGRQVFVICPRIEPSKKIQDEILTEENFIERAADLYEIKAVKNEYEKLSKNIFPDLRIAMLHGKMKTEEKEKAMKGFKKGTTDILVSTSVVEVGIAIPNASVMMIEGSEKFGLSQLHQFRGRVGRGSDQSYCLLFTEIPGGIYFRRLRALLSTDNGFELAEKDLEIRGPGEIFGIRQWGIPDLAMASLKDFSLVEETRNAAKEILRKDPELKKYPLLAERLREFKERVHLE
ncbi:MAG: ATP-dependent DNA helicase RecG [Parcubacteria group bacterium]|nr:MAG: ATP-dependent DNA helicase RecG [Parcubacteria group bacterium]